MSEPKETIELNTGDVVPGVVGNFGLILPTKICQESFDAIMAQIEFRRKCMNQGFDNLIELLQMRAKTIIKANEVEATKRKEPDHAPI